MPARTTVLDSLNAGLHHAFAADPRIYLIGEDLLDPYGGAFKVARGLSTAYSQRVLTSPISEAGITGLAAGMALRGLRPIVEIMFGDFTTLIADQLVNHAAKFRWMYNDQVRVPLLVRTPMGGRRGYGPTHSQTLEKLFLGVPGLGVVAPCALQQANPTAQPLPPGGPGDLLARLALESEDPTLFVENKLLYLLPVQDPASLPDFAISVESEGEWLPGSHWISAPTYRLTIQGAPAPTLTLAAYGYMAELARQAMLRLAYEHEIFAELVIPTRLAPVMPALQPVLDSAQRTGALLVIEEGSQALGWSAEVLAQVSEKPGTRLRIARRLAALNLPIPAAGPLETAVLPSIESILSTCLQFSIVT